MVTPTHTRTTTTWSDTCTTCQAVIVGMYPGDVKLAQDRQGWTHCPRCTRTHRTNELRTGLARAAAEHHA